MRLLINHNKLLRQYDGCIGVKTGFTKKTGRCLVSAAERGGVTLIAVTLGAPDDWRDHTALLDHGFSRCRSVTLAEPEAYSLPVWVESGEREYIMAANLTGLRVTLPAGTADPVPVVELPRFLFAPVRAGDTVGRVIFRLTQSSDGRSVCLGQVSLTAQYEAAAVIYKRSFRERISDWLYALFHGSTAG